MRTIPPGLLEKENALLDKHGIDLLDEVASSGCANCREWRLAYSELAENMEQLQEKLAQLDQAREREQWAQSEERRAWEEERQRQAAERRAWEDRQERRWEQQRRAWEAERDAYQEREQRVRDELEREQATHHEVQEAHQQEREAWGQERHELAKVAQEQAEARTKAERLAQKRRKQLDRALNIPRLPKFNVSDPLEPHQRRNHRRKATSLPGVPEIPSGVEERTYEVLQKPEALPEGATLRGWCTFQAQKLQQVTCHEVHKRSQWQPVTGKRQVCLRPTEYEHTHYGPRLRAEVIASAR